MSKLVLVPIESLEERYSEQWNRWFPRELDKFCVQYKEVHGDPLLTHEGIRQGKFLDVIGTNYYKADQLKQLCLMVNDHIINIGCNILFEDMWFPGLEMLAYMRDALGLQIKIWGILHAGTYDPNDFLAQKKMWRWGRHCEKSWLRIVDGAFVATDYHRRLIIENRSNKYDWDLIDGKIHVTGLPIYPDFVQVPQLISKNDEIYPHNQELKVKGDTKQNLIVFPHRLDPEKQPEIFEQLACDLDLRKKFPDWSFLRTKDVCETKQQYYKLLNRAKISVSCALQETWGIAMIESTLCGCIPIVPNRLSYQELYPQEYRYDTYEDLKEMICNRMSNYDKIINSNALFSVQKDLVCRGKEAIPNMLKIMKIIQ